METQREDKPAEAEGEAGCCYEHRTLCAGLSSLARVWQSELLVKLPLLDPPISWSGPLVPLGQEAGLSVMLPPHLLHFPSDICPMQAQGDRPGRAGGREFPGVVMVASQAGTG